MSSIQGNQPVPRPPVSEASQGWTFNDKEALQMSYFLQHFLKTIYGMVGVFGSVSGWNHITNYFDSTMAKFPISDQTLDQLKEHLNQFIQELNGKLKEYQPGKNLISPWNFKNEHFEQGYALMSHIAEAGKILADFIDPTFPGHDELANAANQLEHFANFGPVWDAQTMSQATNAFLVTFNKEVIDRWGGTQIPPIDNGCW
jgi:hypothetical protein